MRTKRCYRTLYSFVAFCVLFGTAQLSHAANNKARVRLKDHYDSRASALGSGALLSAKVKWHGNTQTRDFLAQHQYDDIRDGVIKFLGKRKPQKHVYVGIGRSPTVVVAMLQKLGIDALNLPTSGLTKKNQPTQKQWNAHFDKTIPASYLAGDKNIVIFDRVSSGESINIVKKAFTAYLKHKKSSVVARRVAFVSDRRHPENSLRRVNLDDYPELNDMNKYGPWAEFGHFVVGKDKPSSLKARKQYKTLQDNLEERMIRDATLHAYVTKFNGD